MKKENFTWVTQQIYLYGLSAHNEGINQSTKGHKWIPVYYEAYLREEYAYSREQALKKNRRMKALLSGRIKESLSY